YEDAGDVFVQKLDINGNLQWDTAGIPLCLAEDVQISLNIVNDNNGGAYIIWIDSRNPGGFDIYGTHVLSNGTIATGWEANGNPIASESGDQDQHTFWEDGSGGAILAWHDKRNANDENIYIQRIASDGSLLWNTTGVLLCNDPGIQETPKMTPDGTGNFIFTWRDKRSDIFGDIYAQRADINGNLIWSSEIEVYTGDGIQINPRITQASDNEAIIVWEDGRNEIAEDKKDIYIQKIDLDGNLVWNADGVPIAVAINNQINPRLVGDDNGGSWIIWGDGRNEVHPYADIYVQHVNSSGSVLLPTNGKEICIEAGYQFSPLIKKSGNEIFLVWGDNRTGSTGIYIQILDNSGNTLLEENGEIIFYGLCGDALNYQIFPNGSNQVIIWEDTRFTVIVNQMIDRAKQIYIQVLNNDGSINLLEDGQPITTMTGFNQETMDAYLYPDSNILGVVWEENKEGYKQIYAQAVDLAGNFLWSDSIGIRVGESIEEQKCPKISTINNCGTYEFYIGWEDFTDSYDTRINGQKIIDGVLQWGPGGKTIADRDGNDELCDIVDGFYIWRNNSWPDYYVYAKLVDENGNTAPGWEEDGKLICGAQGVQSNAKGLIVPQGLLIVWEDLRADSLYALDIYGQIVTEDGTTLWEDDGIPLVSLENDQSLSNFLYNDGIVLVWEDFRSGTNYDIYMQKFDENGNEIWQDNGVEVIVDNFNQQSPYLVSDGEDYMIFCENYESEGQSNLFAQMLDENGDLIPGWPEDGVVICDAIKNQKKPMAVTDSDYSYVIYEDTRSSGKTDIYNIYAQKVRFEPVDVDEDEIHHESYVLNQNYPNPFKSSTAISFNLNPSTLKKAKVKIYNIKGQQVRSINAESNKLFWNGKDNSGKSVANGIYLYRLEADDYKSKPRKMILLK
ncbi:MAG: T9SS type A sorting domain-containing protein, partial [Candidatus Cloacimonetes bacterium]|nr:T9SS type A sorting domain-containing protein [Candidatus Cloacimonadota bacterium]